MRSAFRLAVKVSLAVFNQGANWTRGADRRDSARRAKGSMNMRAECTNFLRDERAATAIEYGLMAALLAVTLITILTGLGGQMSSVFSEVSAAAK